MKFCIFMTCKHTAHISKNQGKKSQKLKYEKMKNWWNHNQLKWSICVILNSSRNEKENKTKISRNLSSQMQRQLKICVNRLIVQNKSARKKIIKSTLNCRQQNKANHDTHGKENERAHSSTFTMWRCLLKSVSMWNLCPLIVSLPLRWGESSRKRKKLKWASKATSLVHKWWDMRNNLVCSLTVYVQFRDWGMFWQ